MASCRRRVPAVGVYLVCPARIASAAASLMCSGVSKSGSPAPRSTTSTPAAFSASAACIAARVDDGCIRETFSETGKAAPVVLRVELDIFLLFLPRCFERLTDDGNRAHSRAQAGIIDGTGDAARHAAAAVRYFFAPPFLAPLFRALLFLAPPFEADFFAPPFLPPFLAGAVLSFLPYPEPPGFLPPPVILLTVAHARFSASSSETPRFS